MQMQTLQKFPVFRIVWASQLINSVGNAIFLVTIVFFLTQRKDAPEAIGAILSVFTLGSTASLLIAGVLADRMRCSRVMILSDSLSATGLILIMLLGASGSLVLLCSAALIMGIGGGFYRPSYGALLPFLVSEDAIRPANALRSQANRIGAIFGAAIGGVICSYAGPEMALAIDLLSFGVSIIVMLRVRDSIPAPTPKDEETSFIADFKEGVAYVTSRHWIAAIMLQGAVQLAFVIAPLGILLPLALRSAGASSYGAAVSIEAVGALLGASYASRIEAKHLGLIALLALTAQAPEVLALALRAPAVFILFFCFVSGTGLSVFGVIWVSQLQSETPRQQLGRVLSLDSFSNSAFYPVGIFLAGYGITAFGPTKIAFAATGILLVSIITPLFIPGVRNFKDRPKLKPESQQRLNTAKVGPK